MEDQRIAPHSNSRRVITKCKTERSDKQPFGVGEDPDGCHVEEVDKVAQIGQEVVVTFGVVGEITNGHEVEQLGTEPQVEVLWAGPHQIPADEDVEHTGDERDLLAQRHGGRLTPLLAQTVHAILHPAAVLFKLFVSGRHASFEFSDHTFPGVTARRPQLLALLAHFLFLHIERELPFLEALGELEVVEQVEDAQLVEWREGLPVLRVGAAVGEGRVARQAARRGGRRIEVIVIKVIEEGILDIVDGWCRGHRIGADGGIGLSALSASVLHHELLLEGEDGRAVPVVRVWPAEEATER